MAGTVTTFGGGGTSRMLGRSTAATGSTSISVNQPVQSLVTLYLLVDEDLKYPVATIKSGTDGSYDVAPSDLQEFLTNPTLIISAKTMATFFQMQSVELTAIPLMQR